MPPCARRIWRERWRRWARRPRRSPPVPPWEPTSRRSEPAVRRLLWGPGWWGVTGCRWAAGWVLGCACSRLACRRPVQCWPSPPSVLPLLHSPLSPPSTAPPLPLPGPPEADLDAAVDYHALARQHVVTSSADLGGVSLAAPRHKPLVIRAVSSIFQVRRWTHLVWCLVFSVPKCSLQHPSAGTTAGRLACRPLGRLPCFPAAAHAPSGVAAPAPPPMLLPPGARPSLPPGAVRGGPGCGRLPGPGGAVLPVGGGPSGARHLVRLQWGQAGGIPRPGDGGRAGSAAGPVVCVSRRPARALAAPCAVGHPASTRALPSRPAPNPNNR